MFAPEGHDARPDVTGYVVDLKPAPIPFAHEGHVVHLGENIPAGRDLASLGPLAHILGVSGRPAHRRHVERVVEFSGRQVGRHLQVVGSLTLLLVRQALIREVLVHARTAAGVQQQERQQEGNEGVWFVHECLPSFYLL